MLILVNNVQPNVHLAQMVNVTDVRMIGLSKAQLVYVLKNVAQMNGRTQNLANVRVVPVDVVLVLEMVWNCVRVVLITSTSMMVATPVMRNVRHVPVQLTPNVTLAPSPTT
jgi:hypothetical protein